MKKLLILFLSTIYMFAFSVNMDNSKLKCDKILKNIAYTSCFNYKTNTPLYSYYTLEKYKVNKKMKRYGRFLIDRRLPKEHQVKNSDYKYSGYDRGHLCPNAVADWNYKAMMETFLFSNIAPQNPKHNRYGWKSLEKIVRKMVNRYGDAIVITGVYFTDINNKLKNKVSIPQYWYKVVYIPSKNIGFAILTKNEPLKKSQLKRDLLPIRNLEKFIGIKFFTDMNRIKQDSFKKRIDPRIRKFFN